jgi:hypothetical protein
MSRKKNTAKAPAAPAAALPALKIGSRVRCTDDQVEGRIVWANAVSVKIKWDDGAQVTWRRDTLAGRPVVIVADEDDGSKQLAAETIAAPADGSAEAAVGPTVAATEQAVAEPVAPSEEPATAAAKAEPQQPGGPDESAANAATAPAQRRRPGSAPAAPTARKVSALDGAAKVLAEEGRPMTCKEMIEAMAARGYWTSPGGKTPAATLYSALLRELTTKGDQARFAKTGRGTFAHRGAV